MGDQLERGELSTIKTKSEFAAKNRETVFVYKDLIIKW